MSRPAQRRGQAGFTLIELLVALTLVGLMSVAIFGGLSFGTRTWEVGAQRGEQLSEMILVQNLLRRHLAQLTAPDLRLQPDEVNPVFDGKSRALRFVAPLSAHVGVRGLYHFELEAVRSDDEGYQLVLRWQLYRPDRREGSESELDGERVLIEGLEEVEFSYYGALQGGDDALWTTDWTSDTLLPSMIAIDGTFSVGDKRRWPAFRVAPQRVPKLARAP